MAFVYRIPELSKNKSGGVHKFRTPTWSLMRLSCGNTSRIGDKFAFALVGICHILKNHYKFNSCACILFFLNSNSTLRVFFDIIFKCKVKLMRVFSEFKKIRLSRAIQSSFFETWLLARVVQWRYIIDKTLEFASFGANNEICPWTLSGML